MASGKYQQVFQNEDIWIISRGRTTRLDMCIDSDEGQTVFVKEYRISELARYMLNPDPIEVKKTLIGCEIHYRDTFTGKVKKTFKTILPSSFAKRFKEKKMLHEKLMANRDQQSLGLKDNPLQLHVEKIRSALSDYDPVLKRLTHLDKDELADVIGICEDIGGNRSLLNLKGGLEEKIKYMRAFLLKEVGVILEKANVSDGLFDMSGFDFASFNPAHFHRLIKFYADGRPRFCLIDSKGDVEFWIDNVNTIQHMHLLEQSIQANPRFNDALGQCTKGEATPLRLLFKRQLDIDYTKSPLPALYRDLFDTYEVGSNEKDTVIKSLKNSQMGILFNYMQNSQTGDKKLLTNISVLHDVRALEGIKNHSPKLYAVINKMASDSEAGKYYLLDHIKGCSNE